MRKITNPWECPAGDSLIYRLVELSNLPPGKCQSAVNEIFATYRIEHSHFFGRKALVQFVDPVQARLFVTSNRNRLMIQGYPISVRLSPLGQLVHPPMEPATKARSRVICIQVIKLRVCLGIQDIYDECSQFGIVEKIICFEKTGQFALVQMETVEQAALVLANLSNAPRHMPAFQFRVQYSKNPDIVIKFNNWKSFDFTGPDAQVQFAQLREASAGQQPFFVVEKAEGISQLFDFWRPVHFDPEFSPILSVSGYEESKITYDILRNLCCQYGPVMKVKFTYKHRRTPALVQFGNSLYARMAFVYLQECLLGGRRLIFECYSQNEFKQNEYNDGGSKEYSNEQDDFDICDYEQLWFPSECVKSRNVPIKDVPVPEGAIVDMKTNTVTFQSVAEATDFIVERNMMRIGKTDLILGYAKPVK